jgi:alkylated DNA repair dioxygenase AlkB
MKDLDSKYNHVMANWYENKDDYISYHSDCEIGVVDDGEVSIISLYRGPKCRTLSIIPKNKSVDFCHDTVEIVMRHGSIVTMCGDMQKKFKHGIKKESDEVEPRISLSFRQFCMV